MQWFLLEELDIIVTQQAISITLKSMKISLKSLRKQAAERNEILRDLYMIKLTEFTAQQLVFVDESGANERTADRKRGWSLLSIKPTVKKPLKRSKRWSMLPAYSLDGVIAYHLYHRSINGARFKIFLEHYLLPRCNPFPMHNSVIVIDNCSTHHTPAVSRLCQQASVKLLYLPPYSPDFNPIEELFSVIKAWMKRNHELVDIMGFDAFLEEAVVANSDGRFAKNHFRHSNIIVE